MTDEPAAPAEPAPAPAAASQPGQPDGTPAAAPLVLPGAGAAMPPIPPAQLPQLAGLMVSMGVNQPQQNPQVVQYITAYLSKDSDNRLTFLEAKDKRNHIFRMATLAAVGIIAAIVLSIPLVALYRGNMDFVSQFFDKYFQMMVIILLALLGGGKLFDLIK
jgi:cation transport ATPase